jgi:hypothetical protein
MTWSGTKLAEALVLLVLPQGKPWMCALFFAALLNFK